MNKTAQGKPREVRTKKDLMPSCRVYPTCERAEKTQGRCNPRCCPGFKKPKR